MVYISILLLLLISLVVIIYYKISYRYWQDRGVPVLLNNTKFPFGDLPSPIFYKSTVAKFMQDLYNDGKNKNLKYGGLYQITKPIFVPIHPDYIKLILQKDFRYFTQRGFYYNEKDDPLSANLFAIGGKKWDFIRKKLSPAFTAGKVKVLFHDLLHCSYQLSEIVQEHYDNNKIVNIKNLCENFTINVIGACAFGLKCNSFEDPNSEFKKQGQKIFHVSPMRFVKGIFAFSYPKLAKKLGICFFDQNTAAFFIDIVNDALKLRKNEGFTRKHFLNLLLQLEESNLDQNEECRLSVEELTAQVFIFFAAGFETTSIALAFSFYELALNQDIQEKLRVEINSVLEEYDGEFTYDAIMNMKYLNQVVEESLRKYPPAPMITRMCVKDYQVPDTKVVIEKGTGVAVLTMGLHHDPEYYPEPDRFDPDRFSEQNRANMKSFTYLPFGEGPRICVGLRFGLMQVKVGLAVLVRKYKFTLNNKTKVPLEFDQYGFTLSSKHGIYLNIESVE